MKGEARVRTEYPTLTSRSDLQNSSFQWTLPPAWERCSLQPTRALPTILDHARPHFFPRSTEGHLCEPLLAWQLPGSPTYLPAHPPLVPTPQVTSAFPEAYLPVFYGTRVPQGLTEPILHLIDTWTLPSYKNILCPHIIHQQEDGLHKPNIPYNGILSNKKRRTTKTLKIETNLINILLNKKSHTCTHRAFTEWSICRTFWKMQANI